MFDLLLPSFAPRKHVPFAERKATIGHTLWPGLPTGPRSRRSISESRFATVARSGGRATTGVGRPGHNTVGLGNQTSHMPNSWAAIVTKRDFADLIEYLVSLKATLKPALRK